MFQILSLDGGGIKGLFSAAILAALEEDLKTRVTDHFDLIAGTSTGGVIALALGLGLAPKRIVEFYVAHGPRIFRQRLGFAELKSYFMRKHPQRPLAEALQATFGEATLSKSTKRLVIPSYSLDEDDVYIFRTAHAERLKRDYRELMWKVALATSAAPTYFPVCRQVDGSRHIDGGVWANNPSMVALAEATGTLNEPLANIKLFSLGTSDALPRRPTALNWGGKLRWAYKATAVDILMKGQSLGAINQARFLLGKENVLRLSPVVPYGEFTLDGATRADALIAKARHHSRVIAPTFEALFGPHTAAPFTSLYQAP